MKRRFLEAIDRTKRLTVEKLAATGKVREPVYARWRPSVTQGIYASACYPLDSGTPFIDALILNGRRAISFHWDAIRARSPWIDRAVPVSKEILDGVREGLEWVVHHHEFIIGTMQYCNAWYMTFRFPPPIIPVTKRQLSQRWPLFLRRPERSMAKYLESGTFDPGGPKGKRQHKRIVEEAQTKLLVSRVAFTDDLSRIKAYLKRLDKRCRVQFMMTNPEMLRQVTKRELPWLKKHESFWERLERTLHFQARVRYFDAPLANFARAGIDSLCALRAVDVLLDSHQHADFFTLSWLAGPPSFRGTYTENEIAYVDTVPWAPGILGRLHMHRAADREWPEVRKLVDGEIARTNPRNISPRAAHTQLEEKVLEALPRARRIRRTGAEEIKHVEGLIRDIGSIHIEKLEEHRGIVKDALTNLFEPLVDQSRRK